MAMETKTDNIDGRSEKPLRKYARKLAFSKFVDGKQDIDDSATVWKCCGEKYAVLKDFHRHVAQGHQEDILKTTNEFLDLGCPDAHWKLLRKRSRSDSETENPKRIGVEDNDDLPSHISEDDVYPWLPKGLPPGTGDDCSKNTVLLFYKYRDINNTTHVHQWQETLCRRLHLTGKVRIAREGINGTVAGTTAATQMYTQCMLKHPLFSHMKVEDFKVSNCSGEVFTCGLKVGVYQEIVPMGIPPDVLSYTDTGRHLTVDEFHDAVKTYKQQPDDNTVFVDCRNFYESKIGQFEGAMCPSIRKFSYWPEYIDKNRHLFENKRVYMYCTGGIRCERGSAYLLKHHITNEVYQLQGGIHKYIEAYPEGFFRGKMFVFDDRYHIQANEDIISSCAYCDAPWDHYQPCSSPHCHQLVLSCTACREGGQTACCRTCQGQAHTQPHAREECECTQSRPRIPLDHLEQSISLAS